MATKWKVELDWNRDGTYSVDISYDIEMRYN